MYSDDALDREHVGPRQGSQSAFESFFRDGRQLVSHGFARFADNGDDSFAWIDASGAAGKRYDEKAVENGVGCVVADNDRRSGLTDFPADGRLKINPPDLTAPHEHRRRSAPRSTPALHAPAPGLPPWPDTLR